VNWTRRTSIAAFAVPYGATVVLCFLFRPEPGALFAPAFGPWAGVIFGHWSCTIARQLPVVSYALLALGAAALAGVRFVPRQPARGLLLALAALWAAAWEIAAVLSVLNTTS